MKKRLKKTALTILGSLVLVAGILMIPYPGPGWLVVFAGLGILATEYDWARNVLHYAKSKYDTWQYWLKRQSVIVKTLVWLVTATVVVVTIWILNGYGFINDWLNLGFDSLRSPLPLFN